MKFRRMNFDYIEHMAAARSIKSYDDGRQFATRIARRYFGIEHVSLYTCAPGEPAYVFDTYDPASWSHDRMTRLSDNPNDPAIRHARAGRRAAQWDTRGALSSIIGFERTIALQRELAKAREDGVRGGVTVGFTNQNGRVAYMNLTSTSATDVRDLHPFAPAIDMVCGTVLAVLADITAPTVIDHVRLTQRQIDILRMRRECWTIPQIADALRIAQSTVVTHIRDAARMLGVPQRFAHVEAARLKFL